MKYMFLLFAILFCSCKQSQTKIVIDFKKAEGGWIKRADDSIWWEQGRFITKDTGFIRCGYWEQLDTVFGLANMKPVVIITPMGDTLRKYFGDTVNLYSCPILSWDSVLVADSPGTIIHFRGGLQWNTVIPSKKSKKKKVIKDSSMEEIYVPDIEYYPIEHEIHTSN